MMKTPVGVDPRAALWRPPFAGLHQPVRIEVHLRRKITRSTSWKHLFAPSPSTIAALLRIDLHIGGSKPFVRVVVQRV
ncbi:hypothetical protein [Paraburkholderia hiiakae]|uniref:hypothetical protein n=1 Tax=Paraburkholderia hiiakae TaxID=1081782 RepID=UPI001919756A|nr:hypothetical protein [Paraburkholderia hiiakae]